MFSFNNFSPYYYIAFCYLSYYTLFLCFSYYILFLYSLIVLIVQPFGQRRLFEMCLVINFIDLTTVNMVDFILTCSLAKLTMSGKLETWVQSLLQKKGRHCLSPEKKSHAYIIPTAFINYNTHFCSQLCSNIITRICFRCCRFVIFTQIMCPTHTRNCCSQLQDQPSNHQSIYEMSWLKGYKGMNVSL